MSSTKGFSFSAGAVKEMGFVPRTEVRPNVGTTSGAAFVMLSPMRSCSRAMRL